MESSFFMDLSLMYVIKIISIVVIYSMELLFLLLSYRSVLSMFIYSSLEMVNAQSTFQKTPPLMTKCLI